MPFQMSWDNPEQDRLLLEFSPPFSWNDFHVGIHDAHQRISSVEHTVDLIIWAHVGMPPGFALPQFRTAFQLQPPNTGRVFIIPEEKARMLAFIKRLAMILEQAFPQKSPMVFVNSVEQARQMIQVRKLKPA